MSEILRVNYFYCITFFCLGFTVKSEDYTSEFYKMTDPNYVILNTLASDKATSITECASKCVSQNCSCFSFNSLLERCDLGYCKASNTSAIIDTNIYATCNSKTGFKMFQSGSVKACAWVSPSSTKVDYVTARDDCRAKGSYLYALKTVEKLKILQENFPSSDLWVGLNDVEEEGVFRWENDNTISDATLLRHMFAAGQPDDTRGRINCIHYGYLKMLDDQYCSVKYSYICEHPISNRP